MLSVFLIFFYFFSSRPPTADMTHFTGRYLLYAFTAADTSASVIGISQHLKSSQNITGIRNPPEKELEIHETKQKEKKKQKNLRLERNNLPLTTSAGYLKFSISERGESKITDGSAVLRKIRLLAPFPRFNS